MSDNFMMMLHLAYFGIICSFFFVYRSETDMVIHGNVKQQYSLEQENVYSM